MALSSPFCSTAGGPSSIQQHTSSASPTLPSLNWLFSKGTSLADAKNFKEKSSKCSATFHSNTVSIRCSARIVLVRNLQIMMINGNATRASKSRIFHFADSHIQCFSTTWTYKFNLFPISTRCFSQQAKDLPMECWWYPPKMSRTSRSTYQLWNLSIFWLSRSRNYKKLTILHLSQDTSQYEKTETTFLEEGFWSLYVQTLSLRMSSSWKFSLFVWKPLNLLGSNYAMSFYPILLPSKTPSTLHSSNLLWLQLFLETLTDILSCWICSSLQTLMVTKFWTRFVIMIFTSSMLLELFVSPAMRALLTFGQQRLHGN